MKSLYDKIIESGEIFATPGNTLGMGNPGFDGEYVTEPISPIGKPAEEKPVRKRRKYKKLSEALVGEINGKLIGSGSEGTVYDCGGRIKKVLFPPDNPDDYIKLNSIKVVDLWANTKGLEVIPEIKDWDKENLTYTLPKYKLKTHKAQLLDTAINRALFSSNPEDWTSKNMEKLTTVIPNDDEREWVIDWFKKFRNDEIKIMDKKIKGLSDDVRLINLGEDSKGRVWCFDWFDPFCSGKI